MGPYGQIVREIKTTAKEFQSVQFIHEAQGSNVDAHNLATSSSYKDLCLHMWFLDPPVGVTPIMINKIWG